MRISTQHIFNLANINMADANEAIYKTQEQISTGKKIQSAADDPVAAVRINNLTNYLDTIDQYEKNITTAKNNLSLEESALDSINNLLQRLEELAIQAGNTATLTPAEYNAIASEVNSRTDELLSLVNTQNSHNDYIFAGFKSDSPAFAGDLLTGFQFQGDEGQLSIQVDKNTFVKSSDSGKAIFVDVQSDSNTARATVPSSNRASIPIEVTTPIVVDQTVYDEFYPEDMIIKFNEDTNVTPAAKNFTITERSTGKVLLADQAYTPGADITVEGLRFKITGTPASSATGLANGDQVFIDSSDTQDVLTTVQRFYDAMQGYDGSSDSRTTLEQIVADTIANLSNAQESVSQTMTAIGARNNTLEGVKYLHADSNLVTREILSDLNDVDYAEAASRLSAQTLVLQATQASFLTIRELSLISQI